MARVKTNKTSVSAPGPEPAAAVALDAIQRPAAEVLYADELERLDRYARDQPPATA